MSRTWKLLITGLVVLGVIVRVWAWWTAPPLDQDEVALLLNLRALDGWALASRPLQATELTQAAPPIFLWTVDLFAGRGLPNERLLRLEPMLAGCLLVPAVGWLTWLACRRMTDVRKLGVPVAMGIVAISPNFVLAARRTKQYSGDALLACGFTGLLLITQHWSLLRRHLLLGGLAAGLVWRSHTIVLVYAGLAVVDVLASGESWKKRLLEPLPGGLLAIASTLLLWLLSASRQRDEFLRNYWTDGFAAPSNFAAWPLEVLETSTELARYLLLPLGLVSLLWIAVAMVRLGKIDRPVLAWLLAPAIVTIVMATLRLYPFAAQRINLFFLPMLVALIGCGVPTRREFDAKLTVWPARISAGLLVVVGVAAVVELGRDLLEPWPNPTPALRYVADQPGAELVVSSDPGMAEHLELYLPHSDLRVVEPDAVGSGPVHLVVSGDPKTRRRQLEKLRELLPDHDAGAIVPVAGGLVQSMTPAQDE